MATYRLSKVSGPLIFGLDDALYLGIYGTCDMRCDDGQLNEVRVFDRALTANIRALYTNET